MLVRLQGVVPAEHGGAVQCGSVSKDTQAVMDSACSCALGFCGARLGSERQMEVG